MRSVREALVHARGIEIPHRRPAHDIQSIRAEDGEVDRRVELLHKPTLLPPRADAAPDCNRPDHALHQELAGEGEDDGVEGHESEVLGSFAILRDVADVGGEGARPLREGRVRVGEEDGAVQRVLLAWVDEVEGEDGEGQDQRDEPCVLYCETLRPAQEILRFPAFAPFFSRMVWLFGM